MKQFIALVALAFVWGCAERGISPVEYMNPHQDVQYGKSAVKLPAMALVKGTEYKFSLSISGDGMTPMNFSWPVKESGQSFVIDKIPTGSSRKFEGRLYGMKGEEYQGSAYADIYAGKTSYVSLVLSKAGSAQVEVIIQDDNPGDKVLGCFDSKGYINTDTGMVDLSGIIFEISTNNNGTYYAYFKRKDDFIGKFSGTFGGTTLSGQFGLDGLFGGYLTLYFSTDYSYFKGQIFVEGKKEVVGEFYGGKVDCEGVIPPPGKCFNDTLGGPNSTSCKDAGTWKKYASERCAQSGAMLNNYSLQDPCGYDKEEYYATVCFECCVLTK